jgi:hypothetical protein
MLEKGKVKYLKSGIFKGDSFQLSAYIVGTLIQEYLFLKVYIYVDKFIQSIQ